MLEIRFTKAADSDIAEILDYTIERFGVNQASAYRDGFSETFKVLQTHPEVGSPQGHIKPNTRRFVYESHAIYYQLSDTHILILRILGPGRDPIRHLR